MIAGRNQMRCKNVMSSMWGKINRMPEWMVLSESWDCHRQRRGEKER